MTTPEFAVYDQARREAINDNAWMVAVALAPEAAVAAAEFTGVAAVSELEALVPQTLNVAETRGLRELFGQGPSGARALLKKMESGKVKLPAGVTKKTLVKYKAMVRAAASKTANAEVNQLRFEAINKFLGLH